jgi:HSP20 family molecular chaperone IbpA
MSESNEQYSPKGAWKRFEELFNAEFPIPAQTSPDDLSWIGPYVQKTIARVLASTPSMDQNRTQAAPFEAETFETLTHVIVKVRIPDRNRARNTNVYAGLNQVRLEEGQGVSRTTIPLPAIVLPESCKAVYKNGILQLQLKKRNMETASYPVPIRYLS